MSLYGSGERLKRKKVNGQDVPLFDPCDEPTEFYDRYRDHLQLAIKGPPEQYEDFSGSLIDAIARPEMLYTGYQYCRWLGGRAPGHDTIRINELSRSDVWNICRELGRNISSGIYRPAEPVTRKIPKIGRSGCREITLFNIADRFVAKAAALVLNPILDHHLSDCCFGGRPSRGPADAIARLYQQVIGQRCYVLLTHDLTNAFHRIPRGRLLNHLKRFFPEPVLALLRRMIARKERHGVPQGLAISPYLLHVYLHYCLDRKWTEKHGQFSRYVDDLMFACRTLDEAEQADLTLRELLESTNMCLKRQFSDSVVDLTSGQAVEWIGYAITLHDESTLAFHIRDSAWDRLHDRLQDSQEGAESTLRGREIIRGWLRYMGPCFEFERHSDAMDRLDQVAIASGFDDLPSKNRMISWWRQGWFRFQSILESAKSQELTSQSNDDWPRDTSTKDRSDAPFN